MIYLLSGENAYARRQALDRLLTQQEADVEYLDGVELSITDLPDIFSGQSLFAASRAIVVNDLAQNKPLWVEISNWLDRIDDTVTLVLIEPTPDKRTKTYKALQKLAKVVVCDPWDSRDTSAAKQWVKEQAAKQSVKLDNTLIDEMVRRATRPSDSDARKLIIDQQHLATVIDQLSNYTDTITEEQLDAVMAQSVQENIFGLLDAALSGDSAKVHSMLMHLKVYEDGFMLLALISSQAVNLGALAIGGGHSVEQVADTIGSNAFALRSLASHRLSVDKARLVVDAFVVADVQSKSGTDPWQALETALHKIALQS